MTRSKIIGRSLTVAALLIAMAAVGAPPWVWMVPPAASGPAYTPPHIVQYVQGYYPSTSATFAAPVTAGDTIVLFTTTEAGAATGASGASFAEVTAVQGGETYATAWIATNVAGGSTTISFSGNVPGLLAVELSPCSTNVFGTQVSGASPMTASLNTTVPCIVLAYWTDEKNNFAAGAQPAICDSVTTNSFTFDDGLYSKGWCWQPGFPTSNYAATLANSTTANSCWIALALH